MGAIGRRAVIAGLAGSAAALAARPRATHAQERMRRIGMLVSGAEGDPEMQARLAGFRQGLARLGWREGQNIHIDYRYGTANAARMAVLAKELVASRPDLLVGMATAPAAALHHETSEIPIVIIGVADPVGQGLIASLARPGGNVTGLLLYEESIVGKWLAMLKEISPNLARVALLTNPKVSPPTYRNAAKTFAADLGLELVLAPFDSAADIVNALESFARTPNGALLVTPDLATVLHRDLIIALAARLRLPAVYQASFWVTAGGLMSYGSNRVAEHRQAAYFVDRILHGEKPTDLPVQAPVKYETVVNLKTAKALGLTVPPGLLVAADEVIE